MTDLKKLAAEINEHAREGGLSVTPLLLQEWADRLDALAAQEPVAAVHGIQADYLRDGNEFVGVPGRYAQAGDLLLYAAPTPAPVPVDPAEIEALRRDAARYRELSTPEITDFLAAVEREALHQRDRWGVDHDAGKADSDWFWLIGFLAGKALHKPEKMLHHIITTAAACLNWHAARVGAHTAMRPGIAGEGAVMAPKPNHDAALAANGEKGT